MLEHKEQAMKNNFLDILVLFASVLIYNLKRTQKVFLIFETREFRFFEESYTKLFQGINHK